MKKVFFNFCHCKDDRNGIRQRITTAAMQGAATARNGFPNKLTNCFVPETWDKRSADCPLLKWVSRRRLHVGHAGREGTGYKRINPQLGKLTSPWQKENGIKPPKICIPILRYDRAKLGMARRWTRHLEASGRAISQLTTKSTSESGVIMPDA